MRSVFILLLLGCVALNSGRVAAQEKIRIAPSSPGLSAWPVHLAARERFFANEGISAEIIVMRTNVAIAALVTGTIDFTTAGGSAMRAAVNGAPLKVILNSNKKADLWIIGRKDLQRIEELKGKIVGVGGNLGSQYFMVYEALKAYGLEKDVQVVSTGDVANGFLTLQQGGLPAVALTPPYSLMAKQMGFRELIRIGNVVSVWPTTGLVTSKEKLDREPQQVRRAVRAVMKAVEFARARKADMAQFISKQYKLERELADAVYDAVMETTSPTLWLTDQEVQVELNRIAEQTKTKISAKPADVADFTITRQVASELGR